MKLISVGIVSYQPLRVSQARLSPHPTSSLVPVTGYSSALLSTCPHPDPNPDASVIDMPRSAKAPPSPLGQFVEGDTVCMSQMRVRE